MNLSAELFPEFMKDVHGQSPFPWQIELAKSAVRGEWPSSISLPTASGKTALIDIAVFTLACGAPSAARRIFFVIDRRIVVDEATERADKLACRLREHRNKDTVAGEVARALIEIAGDDSSDPLLVATLRGGLAKEDSWTRSPLQPTVCCSTVDQVGSSILFRAYGSRSNYNWPIRAALAAYDSLIIVDEAHTANAFLETLARIARYRQWGQPGWAREDRGTGRGLQVIEMSATPRDTGAIFRETDADWNDPILSRRWNASKTARLIVAPANDERAGDFDALIDKMSSTALGMRDGAQVIGIVVNRVATARAVHQRLLHKDCHAILMTGRSRPYDRDQLWEKHRPYLELGRESQPERTIFLVATQCIEVGANIDLDALVTEIAPIDALEQRFGRLNRDGRPIQAQAAVVAQSDQTSARYSDKVYGKRLAETWAWLKDHAQRGKKSKRKTAPKDEAEIDVGIAALRSVLPTGPERAALCTTSPSAPVLLPAHIDRLSETAPIPATEPDPALFLHGPQSGPADVLVVWRADLDESDEHKRVTWPDIVSRVPPRPEEAVAVPVWAVRKWLADDFQFTPEMTDLEGAPGPEKVGDNARSCLRWTGPDDSKVITGQQVRPGMTIVVPASYGGCDDWGWNPAHKNPVTDIADLVSVKRQKPSLRLHPELRKGWFHEDPQEGVADTVSLIRNAATIVELKAALRALAQFPGTEPQIAEIAKFLAAPRCRLRVFRGEPNDDGFAPVEAVAARRELEQESAFSSYTDEVALPDHLEHCRSQANRYVTELGLPSSLAETVCRAAALHDIGKADTRFQSLLRGRIAGTFDRPLAKSGMNAAARAAFQAARRLAGYPSGARHELQSLAMVQNSAEHNGDIDHELLLHLIASHHGRCRPFAPVLDDGDRDPIEVCYEEFSASSDHNYAAAGSGISRRFWSLTRRYGWWGLAYLEMLLRLSDHRASEAEEQIEEVTHEVACD